MELIKRFPRSNLYRLQGKQFKMLLGGSNVNVKDINGNLNPLDNNIVPFSSAKHNFKTKNNVIGINYGDKVNGARYMRELKLLTGESVEIILKDLVITPGIVKKNNTIEWVSGRLKFSTYSTENHVKETINQPAGQVIVYQYKLNGLYPVVKNNIVSFYATNDDGHAFTIERPHYVLADENIQSFDYGWQDIGGNVYELTLPAPMVDSIVDPTLTFGERTGADVTGTHKCAIMAENNKDAAWTDVPILQVRTNIGVNSVFSVNRFDLSDLPDGITINSSTLSIFLARNVAAATVNLRECLTSFGITDTNGGSNEDPATANQATWDKSFQTGSGAGTDWAGGSNFTIANDAGPVLDTLATNSDPIGTEYVLTTTTLVSNWMTTNNGWILEKEGTNINYWDFDSQTSATTSERPLLSITFTAAWFNTNWLNRRAITIDSSKVGGTGNLTDFTVLITEADFDSTDFFSKVKSDGSDIVLTQDDGTTKLKRQLVKIDTTAKTMQLWGKVPTVRGSTPDTLIYIYYNNSAASETNDTAAWENNFQAVYHLEEDDTGTNINDSTVNARDGTKKANAEPSQIDSKIDKGQDFDNVDDNINTNFSNSFTDISITGQIKIESFSGSVDGRVMDKTNGSVESSFKIKDDGAGNERLNWFQGFDGNDGSWDTPDGSIVAGTQYHVAITYNNSAVGNDPIIYIDGVAQTLTEVTTPIGNAITNASNYILGNRGAGDRPMNGILDEFHMYNGILTSDWVNTEVNNQDNPGTFYSLGAEEDVPSVGQPVMLRGTNVPHLRQWQPPFSGGFR